MRTYKRQTSEGFHEQNKKTPEKKKAIQSGENLFQGDAFYRNGIRGFGRRCLLRLS
ncbi:hypothetical protein KGMB03357_22340 [Anaerotignum faecicola]|uniref:Uncharacterized protein n=1 Tax=Anaerotignum faecicola TaxID=2358141 RepID=A0A401LGD1_9FIRM|nr:hypothetical protein KGMB03357_22340 [Anaerotignum faecicola]